MSDDAMTGAQFRREVGVDAERWASRFLAAYAAVDPEALRTHEDRLAYVSGWFRDAMDAVLKAERPTLEGKYVVGEGPA